MMRSAIQVGLDCSVTPRHVEGTAVIMVHVSMALVSVIINGEAAVVKFLFAKMSVLSKGNALLKVVSVKKAIVEKIVRSDM